MQLPFEQIASYDKPQILLTQALDNEITLRGAMQTLVDSDGLSPIERDSFTTRLKDQVGRNSVTDTAIDVLTNPFVLLMAVTSPVGGQALSRTGKAIFDMSARFSPFVKEQGGLHAALGMLAPMQLFRGTALTPAVHEFSKGVEAMEKQMLDTVGEPLRKVLAMHGLESLNPDMVKDAALKLRATELNDALFASLSGFDRDTILKRLKMVRVMADGTKFVPKSKGGTHLAKDWKATGKWEVELVDTVVPRMVQANMDREIKRLGLTELHGAYRTALNDRRMNMFGDAAASSAKGTFVADPQKLLRAWQGAQLGFKSDGAFKGTGADVVSMLMGPEIAAQVARGSVNPKVMLGKLQELIEGQPEFYMPRNILDLKGSRSMSEILEQRRSRTLVATGSTITRTHSVGGWDPEDLTRLFGRYGRTEAGAKQLIRSEEKIKALTDRGEVARTFRINAQESLSRYFRDTGVTHALYVRTIDEMPKLAQTVKDTRGVALPAKLSTMGKEMFRSPFMDGKVSLAQALQEEHFLLEDRFAKEALEVVMRQATGVQKLEHVATHMALIKGKQGVSAMLESGVGQAMRDSGSWGAGLHKRLKEVADSELTFGGAKGISGSLAKYFYVTHLGLNLASVTMNMMQPLLLASNYGGLPNVLKAYKTAFGELGGYISERMGKHGVRAMTEEQSTALIKKHFKYANADGENLIQIGRDSFSTLDNISFRTDMLGGVGSRESYLYDYPMKLFEKAEWLNRSVAAHSVENLYLSKGLNTSVGTPTYYRMLRDVDEMVSATQFGGNALNTPLGFQGVGPFGRAGNNPLARQFMSFPLRSMTSLTADAGRLGDRGAVKGMGQDFIRGMGISAIFYELGKGLFNTDLSPGLYGASLTQFVGGDRFFQDGNEYIPIPPVVDIPINIIRGALDPGQRQLLQDNLPRLIPGGVAIARAMNFAPSAMNSPLFGLPGSLQKTYVDFDKRTPEGLVGVFKGDGTLIDYQTPGAIFAKQLGVDMGRFKETAGFDGFLLQNRDQILDYRRRAIQALLANEVPKVQKIRDEFKRRYGMDLTISQDQLEAAQKNREVSRTERILDRMPPDQRAMFQQMAVKRAPNMGMTEEQFLGGDTARQRRELSGTQPPTEPLVAPVSEERAFGKFEGFGV